MVSNLVPVALNLDNNNKLVQFIQVMIYLRILKLKWFMFLTELKWVFQHLKFHVDIRHTYKSIIKSKPNPMNSVTDQIVWCILWLNSWKTRDQVCGS